MARHVFLTGPPGVGKTTLIQKASRALQRSGVPVDGFYTEEVRQGGRRVGFDVVTLSGARGPLSRVGPEPLPGKPGCRVGPYVVDVASLEQLALPVLRSVLAEAQGTVCASSTRSARWSSSASPSSRQSARRWARPGRSSWAPSPSPRASRWRWWRRSGAGRT
ncbi:cancer-related nucleoside-triphosphatase isoform X2 [Perognathus longimembris pacificus]|uniref:cancer-related nucleoside-triphosphatase isoform X2 n=1 Tax=Perognathus longimembris pacificus TaxID=214514 RepID=UPI00201953E3|nr:cancer-related nucleoside-triphosphatase isoform X2 [Perognathus longimembris pacificus]